MNTPKFDLSIWHDRWMEGRIGFHREAVNPHLVLHGPTILQGAQRVLVPLCGKTVDMPWLAQQGVDVVGVELVGAAIEAFWREQELSPQVDSLDSFTRSSHDRITLLQGNVFDLSSVHVGTFDAIYDRAALIANPPELQAPYVAQMFSLLKPGGCILLLSYDMPVPPEKGPPFSVDPDRVAELFVQASSVECLSSTKLTPEEEPRLLGRGVPWARECVWRIAR
jgi:thiopurine S-methyltransferase